MSERVPSDAALSWERALETRRTQIAGAPVAAQATRAGAHVGRRGFILASLGAAFVASMLGGLTTLVDYLYPRGVKKAGGPVAAGTIEDYPAGGAPVLNATGGFFVVNLDPADTATNGSGGGEGLLALSRKCPHLGCAVPWNAAFVFQDAEGWFRCPCHQSTYTKAGIRVHGPAPRPMDTLRSDVSADGQLTVHSDEVTLGSDDNPSRALKA
jgi:cytochrome b6-f complex iron-sulfur subunit